MLRGAIGAQRAKCHMELMDSCFFFGGGGVGGFQESFSVILKNIRDTTWFYLHSCKLHI